MKKTIGILGGISLASTIQYYKKITDLYYEQYNDYYYPEIRINSLDFQHFTDLENEHRTEEYIDYIAKGIHALEKSGAEFVIMGANSPHSVFNEVVNKINVPMISIVESTAKRATELKLDKVLLTGIKYTMQSNFYQEVFKKYNIDVITPNETHQDEINSIIFDELVINIVSDQTRKRMLDIIQSYDVEGVILGCTELPLLIAQNICPIPVLDTLSLHAKAALDFSLNKE
ncbi:aspartate racemase [Aneurinibacillus migulanus]|uniref:Aspartate racemase n=1 Tax=Aneurinibacillus migulanus TaxID=47500 RepID=A0A0D1XS82_ANEMI|nr:amino acid racemase [Aneurinibacillus migulanus]KIV57096.1 aspartate racemase [Aneurinibacillus migulanus]KIV57808.1 aspartate racemase [Aneurinibacillus migulanus]KON97022.1 aspartate racemase [Aneurinibacillus migulanus]KPD07644.1 aspartate racemase [Aneurinibacillus migulanus]MED0896035.1 amino acid racemase [Aneurinibacillus migulanus]